MTLIWGDIKVDNIFDLGGEDRDRFRFIDFAGGGWAPPSDDTSFFLVVTLTPPEYQTHWEAYLREYHATLTSEGVALDWEQCRQAHIHKVFMLLVSCCILAKKREATVRDHPELMSTADWAREVRLCDRLMSHTYRALHYHDALALLNTVGK